MRLRTPPKQWLLGYEDTIYLFRTEILKQWNAGHNLVISSEKFDFVIPSDHMMEDFLMMMAPAIGVQDITVVVVYRAPRIDHLVSLWKQVAWKGRKDTFFYFITETLRKESSQYHIIDSLGIVNEFLNRGLKVEIIDSAGVAIRGYDLTNVFACDILKVPCLAKKEVIGSKGPLKTANTKPTESDLLNVTKTQLDMMDHVIKTFDCAHSNLLKHENLTIHYANVLVKNFGGCSLNTNITEKVPYLARYEKLSQELNQVLRMSSRTTA